MIRDEIARALYCQAFNVDSAGSMPPDTLPYWRAKADALLPIVERVAREAFNMGWRECRIYEAVRSCKTEDDIVQKLMEGGQ